MHILKLLLLLSRYRYLVVDTSILVVDTSILVVDKGSLVVDRGSLVVDVYTESLV